MDNIIEILMRIRKGLFIGLAVIFTGMFVRSALDEIKFDMKYLEENFSNLRNQLENKSALNYKGFDEYREHLGIKQWADMQMQVLEREIQVLKDNVKRAKEQSRFCDEELPRFDLALDTSGGRITSIHNTQLLDECSKATILIGACHRHNPPEKVIQSSVEPGQCFCFRGNQGAFTIRLACEAELTGVTFEHIKRSQSPTSDISSAPKTIKLTGYEENEKEKVFDYGYFEFDPMRKSRKFYEISTKNQKKIRYVKVNILNNHGNAEETCIYRIQLHGFVEKC